MFSPTTNVRSSFSTDHNFIVLWAVHIVGLVGLPKRHYRLHHTVVFFTDTSTCHFMLYLHYGPRSKFILAKRPTVHYTQHLFLLMNVTIHRPYIACLCFFFFMFSHRERGCRLLGSCNNVGGSFCGHRPLPNLEGPFFKRDPHQVLSGLAWLVPKE